MTPSPTPAAPAATDPRTFQRGTPFWNLRLRHNGEPVVADATLEQWRGTMAVPGDPGNTFTVGAFQLVLDVNPEDEAHAALAADLTVPNLPWSYIRGETRRSALLSAIPPVPPAPVLARGLAYAIPWEAADFSAQRRRARCASYMAPTLREQLESAVDGMPLEAYRRVLLLDTLYIHPAARGDGLGIALLREMARGIGNGMLPSPEDGVVIDPFPIGSLWAPSDGPVTPTSLAEAKQFAAAITKLGRYYAAGLGLKPLPQRPGTPPLWVLHGPANRV